jgi:microcystin-dependent protein
MTNPYVGEIRIFGFNFAPVGWATCDGQILSISQNTALFSILGTNYGGNGTSTFALPNFQGDTGVQQGQGPGLSQYFIGQQSGTTTVTLNQNNLPAHNHTINTQDAGNSTQGLHAPTSTAFLGNSDPDRLFNATASPTLTMAPQAIGPSGTGQPHDNMQPYEVLLFCIAMVGVYPPRS